MMPDHQLLEKLVLGETSTLELDGISREFVYEALANVIAKLFPGCGTCGRFVNEDHHYLVYDIELIGKEDFPNFRIVESEKQLKLIRC